jgi:SAM-dependent methyltransferase
MKNNIDPWGKIEKTNQLYRERANKQTVPMTCAQQLVEILRPYVKPKMTVLDVGCGAGYFYHSLSELGLDYYGIDPTPEYIEIGKEALPRFGLDPERLQIKGIEEIYGKYDVVVCFNVIQHLPANLKKYLNILADCTKQFMIIRSSFYDKDKITQEYGIDNELPGMKFLNVTYPKSMVEMILKEFGFHSEFFSDIYTGGCPEKLYSNNVLLYPGIYFAQRHIIVPP